MGIGAGSVTALALVATVRRGAGRFPDRAAGGDRGGYRDRAGAGGGERGGLPTALVGATGAVSGTVRRWWGDVRGGGDAGWISGIARASAATGAGTETVRALVAGTGAVSRSP